jgi:autotransporter-associated beta strand protein
MEIMRKSTRVAAAACAASLIVTSAARAAVVGTWTSPVTGASSENWSVAGSTANGGWSNGVVPNAQGDTGQYTTGLSCITLQDIVGGVTVGTLKVDGTNNASWQIRPANDVIMNQDGPGPGFASIINDIQDTAASKANPAIFINSSTGALVLQDDLFISNTSNSTRTSGAIQMQSKINGNGNITIENVSNNPAAAQVAFTGQGNFSGNTTIAKGAVTFTRGDIFTPSPGNIVTIGSAGKGAASLWAVNNGGVGNIENNFVAAAGSGGTLVFGAANTNAATVNIKSSAPTSSIRLDGDLSFSNTGTNGLKLVIGDPITGVGKLTKIGPGMMRVVNTNPYQGGTVVDGGSLAVGNADAINNGFGFYPATAGTLGSGNVTVNAAATFLEIESGVVDAIADTAAVSLAGGGAADVADNGYMLLDSGVNESVGSLLLNGVLQPGGTYGSSASGAMFPNDEYFSGPGILTVASTPEPGTLSLLVLGTAGVLGSRRCRRRR